MTLADRINQLVLQHGSLLAAARATDIPVCTLSRLRSGKTIKPRNDMLLRLGIKRVASYELIAPARKV